MTFEVSIPQSEWEAALLASMVVEIDERLPTGQVRLRSDGVRRTWSATDLVQGVIVSGGPDPLVYDLGVSPAMIQHAVMMGDSGDPVLTVTETGGDDFLVLTAGGGSLWLRDLGHEVADLRTYLPAEDEIGGRARVVARDLVSAIRTASVPREGSVDDPDHAAPFWIGVGNDELMLHVDWEECGTATVFVPASGVEGNVRCEVDARFLRTVVEQFAPGTELEVVIPTSNLQPIAFRTDDLTTMLMPMSTQARKLRKQVEDVVRETFGPLALECNESGDYPLTRRAVTVWARLWTAGDPPVLTVFAPVVDDVEPGPDLLRELNDVNAQTSFVSLVWVDGQVSARVDLVASTLDPDELVVATDRIHRVATEVAPTLAAVLGGRLVEDPVAARLRNYRATIVEAEVLPGRTTPLNGPAAPAEWPFPGPVHVITGYNPQGVSRDDETNEGINQAIAADILERGGRFVHGAGTSADGTYSEPSLVAWGLSRTEAVAMGWRADQDAIFEIDAESVHLVSCMDDVVESWPRREGAGG